jgi:CRISP-associated protein Cas1
MKRLIIEITGGSKYLKKQRGFIVVQDKDSDIETKIPLDSIAALVCYSDGLTITNEVISALLEAKANIVFCNQKYLPVSIMYPLDGNFKQTERMQAQLSIDLVFKKRLWQNIIQFKIISCSHVLKFLDKSDTFHLLADEVKSGDKTNVESLAARRYWTLLFGPDFIRDREQDGINAMLNYAYTILRSHLSRLVVAYGLHPSLGLHHKNQYNHLCLIDDFIEPFRACCDLLVYEAYHYKWHRSVTKDFKILVANAMLFDYETEKGVSPLLNVIDNYVASICQAYLNSDYKNIELPKSFVSLNYNKH